MCDICQNYYLGTLTHSIPVFEQLPLLFGQLKKQSGRSILFFFLAKWQHQGFVCWRCCSLFQRKFCLHHTQNLGVVILWKRKKASIQRWRRILKLEKYALTAAQLLRDNDNSESYIFSQNHQCLSWWQAKTATPCISVVRQGTKKATSTNDLLAHNQTK